MKLEERGDVVADILYLTLSYPDFAAGDVIDSEQFDANNDDIFDKVNEVVTQVNTNTGNISTHTHDARYYTETETDAKYATIVDLVDAVLGTPPAGSVLDTHLSDAAGQIKARVAAHLIDVVTHITAGERVSWDAKPTVAEVNLKSAGGILYNYMNNGGAL
jgi:hypothetical protein